MLRRFLLLLGFLPSAERIVTAAQDGPYFPTHHYPTDESFHIGYRFSYLHTSSNFISALSYLPLTNSASFTLIQHTFTPEFQPNRHLSLGAMLTLDSAALNPGTGAGTAATKLGDQRVFAEYRFIDEMGASLGAAIMVKFPGYSNPTTADLTSSSSGSSATTNSLAILVGDAQIDFTTLITSEFWPSNTVRLRLDAGYTYRSDGFSAELPYMAAIGYAVPRLDIDLRVRGNFSLGNGTDPTATNSSVQQIRTAFENSDFAFSQNPWLLIAQPYVEFWFTPRFAMTADYDYSLSGNNAPHFYQFGLGFIFREASANRTRKQTFQEVDINTDQEAGKFQGEQQGAKPAPNPDDPKDEEF